MVLLKTVLMGLMATAAGLVATGATFLAAGAAFVVFLTGVDGFYAVAMVDLFGLVN